MPQFGERLTGKAGAYAVGVLSVDDRSPGLDVPDSDPTHGSRSHYYVGRVNRDIGHQSNLGVIFADQQYINSFNRNGGLDYRTRIAGRWTLIGQAVTSETQNTDSSWLSGQGYLQGASYSDLHTSFWFHYSDIASGYLTQTGFFTRPDVRQPNGRFAYTFRPTHGPLLSHGPSVYSERIWDHTGLPLDFYLFPSYNFSFKHSTGVSLFAGAGQDRLRPSDYSTLPANVEYHGTGAGLDFYTSPTPSVSLAYSGFAGSTINYSPPPARAQPLSTSVPISSASTSSPSEASTWPALTSSTASPSPTAAPSRTTITRSSSAGTSRWISAWSINFIGEYLATLPNAAYTSVANNKDVYGNLLLTYLPHPGTAFYLRLHHRLCQPQQHPLHPQPRRRLQPQLPHPPHHQRPPNERPAHPLRKNQPPLPLLAWCHTNS